MEIVAWALRVEACRIPSSRTSKAQSERERPSPLTNSSPSRARCG